MIIPLIFQLEDQGSLLMGDSAPDLKRQQMTDFLAKLDDALALKLPITLVLDDPAGNSYIQVRFNYSLYRYTFAGRYDIYCIRVRAPIAFWRKV